MTLMHLALLDSDDLRRVSLKRVFMQRGFSVADFPDMASLYAHIERHYAHTSAVDCTSLTVLLRGLTFSSEFVDKVLPAMRRGLPMTIALQCPEDPDLRIQLFERGADLCLSDRCSVEELVASLWAQARRMTERRAQAAFSLPGYAGAMVAPASAAAPATHVVQERSEVFGAHASGYGQRPGAMREASHGNLAVSPDARLAEATAELQRKAYGTWVLAHEDWILVNPLGAHIGLTGVERRCLTQLADNDRREFSRQLSNDMGRCNFKSMSVVVSRMRKKVHRSGVPLPLHTVHGMGYVFIGKLIRKPAA